MNRTNISIMMCAAFLILGCGSPKKAVQGSSKAFFGSRLFGEVCNSNEAENVCISPLSAQMALSMAASGATGETRDEIYAAMRLEGEVNAASKEIMESINGGDGNCNINIANSIWINDKLDVKESFVNSGKEYFNALVTGVPFNQATLDRINGWCSEETKGKIKSILGRINESDRMYLINALYFKGAWEKKFSKAATGKKPFTKEDGTVAEVDMMYQNIKTSYYEDSIVQMASKSFDGRYMMMFVLPREQHGTEEAILHLAENYESCRYNMKVYEVELSLPKFRSEFSTSLTGPLKEMGIKRAFSGKAEFSGMSDEPLCIDNVIQKTYICVDEEGAEAAAVTAISMSLTARPDKLDKRTLNLNRPFIYMITDITGDNILFMGKVGNPAE